MAQSTSMAQSPNAWATHILALHHKINTSSKLIHRRKCLRLEYLVKVTAENVESWIGHLGVLNLESANAVGEKLLQSLERGLTLIRQCEDKKLLSTFLCGAGEFWEIVYCVTRYSKMMNKLMASIVRFDPARVQSIKKIHDKLELDCSEIQEALISVHGDDRNELINKLKSFSGFHNLWVSSRARRLKYEVLIERLERGLPSIECTDLKSLKAIGIGSRGSVSKALWADEMPVAVKEFFYNEHFEDEYKVLMKLMFTDCSQHVVQILGLSDYDSHKVLIMELMDMDLKKLIENRKGNPLSMFESIDLILQIAHRIRGLHSVNVIHRDIKPCNILVKKNTEKESFTVKLADFGESKAEFETTDPNLHTTNKGTKLYMAPEMEMAVDKEAKYSKKVDVYSFGIVCIEILSGEPPIRVKDCLRKGKYPFFVPSIPIPKDLYTMICACLEPDEDKRPNFEEICDHLWALMEKVLIREHQILWALIKNVLISREDDIQIIDNYHIRAEVNFRDYLRTLVEEGISMMPRVSTPTGKTAVYMFDSEQELLHEPPKDNLVDIELHNLVGIESSGRIKLLRDLPISFKQLVVHQGKKLNLSFA